MLRKIAICLIFTVALTQAQSAWSGQGLLAVVNDQPITSYDVQQQINLDKLFQGRQTGFKQALNDVINQIVKIAEAKRYHMEPSENDISARLGEFAKGLKTDNVGLEGKLKAQGITLDAIQRHITAQISFARLLKYKYHDAVEAKPEDVDRKLAQIKADLNSRVSKVMADPRMKGIQVISLMEIDFPIDAEPGTEAQLLQSRAIEANNFISKFKGCNSARSAASGIFNVKIGKVLEADASKLPKPLSAALASKGVGSAIGPMRSKLGIQVLGYCGTRRITPPKPQVTIPSRGQVEQVVLNEKFGSVEQKYVTQMRKNAIIEYKDASLAQ
jgi:peptidyl-prolyl cis-trans isomerase SurA